MACTFGSETKVISREVVDAAQAMHSVAATKGLWIEGSCGVLWIPHAKQRADALHPYRRPFQGWTNANISAQYQSAGRLKGGPNSTTDHDVARAVLRCAIEADDQLRTPAGPDAIVQRRRGMCEQAFLRSNAD